MSKKNAKKHNKYNSEYCDDSMSFQDCELAILRHAVDESEEIRGKQIANSGEVKKIIEILENYLVKKKLICYGGTAINNILPKYAQFYNRDIEIPDYDFFSPNALDDAKELADIYYSSGYAEVEAKAGMHYGTFKVFVNFIPVADITYLDPELFESISTEAISIAGIKYAPPDFLRMAMYLELSRPAGDVSRWEKVLKRLTLLNKYYPLKTVKNCSAIDFQRKLEKTSSDAEEIYFTVRNSFIEQGVVFFGGYAASLYSKYMPKYQQRILKRNPDFDVLSEDINRTALIVKERLQDSGIKNVKTIYHEQIGELIPERIEIMVGKDTIAFVYSPIACHNYNTINVGDKVVNIATIDTMLSFFLAFIYADDYSFSKDRILCMAKYLFDVEEQNRLEQKGPLKRFSMNCIGTQPGIEDIRAEKAEKFKELSGDKSSYEYQMWFLKYNPAEQHKTNAKAEKIVESIRKTSKKTNKKRKTQKNKRADKGFLY